MKFVIYKDLTGLCVTAQENYNARIQNARKVYKMYDFKTPREIINYWCKFFNCKEEDFIIEV